MGSKNFYNGPKVVSKPEHRKKTLRTPRKGGDLPLKTSAGLRFFEGFNRPQPRLPGLQSVEMSLTHLIFKIIFLIQGWTRAIPHLGGKPSALKISGISPHPFLTGGGVVPFRGSETRAMLSFFNIWARAFRGCSPLSPLVSPLSRA